MPLWHESFPQASLGRVKNFALLGMRFPLTPPPPPTPRVRGKRGRGPVLPPPLSSAGGVGLYRIASAVRPDWIRILIAIELQGVLGARATSKRADQAQCPGR